MKISTLGLASLLFALMLPFALDSCQKDAAPNPYTGANPSLRDSLAHYAYDWYLWNTNLIAAKNSGTFIPSSFSSSDTLRQETDAIKAASDLIPGTNTNEDKPGFSRTMTYTSYLDARNNNPLSFGLFGHFDHTDPYLKMRISYVAKSSPAYGQGVRRGWIVNSINGTPAAYTQSFNTVFYKALFYNNSITINLTNPATNVTKDYFFTKTNITEDEVTYYNVINTLGKKIGYIVYNTFELANGSHPGLDTAFGLFASKGITDIIIDLRDNGGGYTSVANAMSAALLESKYTGIMYTTSGNDSLRKYLARENPKYYPYVFETVYANDSARGTTPMLHVNNVVFIVNYNTASASELVINNVYQHVNTTLICLGRGWTNPVAFSTAGKPFGGFVYSFPQNKPLFSAYLLNFESKNSMGTDDYYSGFSPNVQIPGVQTYDGVGYDWGNPGESGYATALSYLTTGSLAQSTVINQAIQSRLGDGSRSLDIGLVAKAPHRMQKLIGGKLLGDFMPPALRKR